MRKKRFHKLITVNDVFTNSIFASISWEFISTISSTFILFCTSIILARLLIPEDFGIYGYLQLIFSLFLLILDSAIGHIVIRTNKKGVENTAFWFSFITSLIFYIVVFFTAPFVADFFNETRLVRLLRLFTLVLLLVPYTSIQNALEVKNLHFKRSFLYNFTFVLSMGISTILLALGGAGVWSFVIGYITGYFFKTLVCLKFGKWWPSLDLKISDIKSVLRYAGYFSFHDIVSWITSYLDDLLVGKYLGATSLGYYRVGFELGRIPASLFAATLNKVFFSVYSKMQENIINLREFYQLSLQLLLAVVLPIGFLLIVFSKEIIVFLLGYKWQNATIVVQMVAIYGIFASIGGNITLLLRAIDRPQLTFKVQLFRAPVLVVGYFYTAPKGLMAISAAHAIITSISIAVYFLITFKILGLSIDSIKKIFFSIGDSFLFLFVLIFCKFRLFPYITSNWQMFFIIIILIFYFGYIIVKNKKTILKINKILEGKFLNV